MQILIDDDRQIVPSMNVIANSISNKHQIRALQALSAKEFDSRKIQELKAFGNAANSKLVNAVADRLATIFEDANTKGSYDVSANIDLVAKIDNHHAADAFIAMVIHRRTLRPSANYFVKVTNEHQVAALHHLLVLDTKDIFKHFPKILKITNAAQVSALRTLLPKTNSSLKALDLITDIPSGEKTNKVLTLLQEYSNSESFESRQNLLRQITKLVEKESLDQSLLNLINQLTGSQIIWTSSFDNLSITDRIKEMQATIAEETDGRKVAKRARLAAFNVLLSATTVEEFEQVIDALASYGDTQKKTFLAVLPTIESQLETIGQKYVFYQKYAALLPEAKLRAFVSAHSFDLLKGVSTLTEKSQLVSHLKSLGRLEKVPTDLFVHLLDHVKTWEELVALVDKMDVQVVKSKDLIVHLKKWIAEKGWTNQLFSLMQDNSIRDMFKSVITSYARADFIDQYNTAFSKNITPITMIEQSSKEEVKPFIRELFTRHAVEAVDTEKLVEIRVGSLDAIHAAPNTRLTERIARSRSWRDGAANALKSANLLHPDQAKEIATILRFINNQPGKIKYRLATNFFMQLSPFTLSEALPSHGILLQELAKSETYLQDHIDLNALISTGRRLANLAPGSNIQRCAKLFTQLSFDNP